MIREAWLASHPYLQPLADLHALVERTMDEIAVPRAPIPVWDSYLADFRDGVPLLRSTSAGLDLVPASGALASLVERIASNPFPATLRDESAALNAELRRDPDSRGRFIAWLVDEGSSAPPHPGLLRYLGWTVLARYLADASGAYSAWRDEERWLRSYCPTCGAPPSMGHLSGTDPGRLRLLSCGRCGASWRYRRTGCPFCKNTDGHRLSAVAVEGEGGLRVDYCEACGGYLKTYSGDGSERILLADWTSLHLDVVARDRGLKRLAASLYEL